MSSWIVLRVGKRRVDTKRIGGDEDLVGAYRWADVLVLHWRRDVVDLHAPEEAAEELVSAVTPDVLRWSRDERGVLVVPDSELMLDERPYDEIVRLFEGSSLWIPNLEGAPGNDPMRELRESIPVPDVPRSRKMELFVMAPGRAIRELPLVEVPLRVACLDRTTDLAPEDVSAFYLPILRADGFTVKRRKWSDGSTEQLVASRPGEQLVVHAERAAGGTFVRVAAVLNV
jgi:hypothetical protein